MSAYESGLVKIIPATLVYVIYQDKVLLLRRNNWSGPGLYNGLGGKIETGESPFEAAMREVKEESGIEIDRQHLRLRGQLLFPLFKEDKNQDWWVTVFVALLPEGHLKNQELKSSNEGQILWFELSKPESLPFEFFWPGDKLFLPKILDLNSDPIMGTFWYHKGQVKNYQIDYWRAEH